MQICELMTEKKIVLPNPDHTLGIARHEMPQIHADHYDSFFDYLKAFGGRITTSRIMADTLKPTQKDFSVKGVKKMIKRANTKKPVIVSSDNYIIDGHHRWLAAKHLGSDLLVIKVSLPIRKLLELSHNFPETTYKDIYEISQIDNLNNDDAMNARIPAFKTSIDSADYIELQKTNNTTLYGPKDLSINSNTGGRLLLVSNDKTHIISSLLLHSIRPGMVTIGMVWTNKKDRRCGHIISMYKYLLDSGFKVVSSKLQTKFSKHVWKSLVKEYYAFIFDGDEFINQIHDTTDLNKAYTNPSYSIMLSKTNLRTKKINESLTTSYNYTWISNSAPLWKGTAKTEDGRKLDLMAMQGTLNQFYMGLKMRGGDPKSFAAELKPKGNHIWDLMFSIDDNVSKTNKGDAYRIFATVIKMLTDFADSEKPDQVVFGNDNTKTNGKSSRTSLYQKLMVVFAKKAGYQYKYYDIDSVTGLFYIFK